MVNYLMIGLIIGNFTLKYLIGVSVDAANYDDSFLIKFTGTFMTCCFVIVDFGLIGYALERIGRALRSDQGEVKVRECYIGA